MKRFISIIIFISVALCQYNIGDQISINDQQLTKQVCYGHTLETGDNFSLYDLNGEYNGGEYHVMFLDLSASW